MSDVLAGVYSRSDAFKRKLIDALRNPGATVDQLKGRMVDDLRSAREQISAAADEGVNYGPASRALAMKMGEAYNPAGITLWHGSKNPTWMDLGEAFNPNMTANMPSKYLWGNPQKNIAENYAGISEMQRWKAENGLGPAPEPTAGVRKIDLDNAANVLRVKDVKKAASELGVNWGGENPLELLLDAAKAKGYDAVKMEMDGGNYAILNPATARYGAMLNALRKKKD